MATTPQPAKKSYFFDKGYKDLGNTIKGAWARNSDSIKKYASNLGNLGDHGLPAKLFLGLVNILAMVAVVVCGYSSNHIYQHCYSFSLYGYCLYWFYDYLDC